MVQNGQTNDPVASAWLYVFGQFVDHDIDLEETPLTAPAINILVPPDDPVFTSGTSIVMTRDTRSPVTNTIINTVAGYLDLSQLYGSTAAIAATLRNADGTLESSDNGQALPVVNDSIRHRRSAGDGEPGVDRDDHPVHARAQLLGSDSQSPASPMDRRPALQHGKSHHHGGISKHRLQGIFAASYRPCVGTLPWL